MNLFSLHKNSTIFISSIFIVLVIINNSLYQTAYQLHQPFLALVIFLFAVMIMIVKEKWNKYLLGLMLFLLLAVMHSAFTIDTGEEYNRLFNYALILCVYFILFFNGHKLSVVSFIYYGWWISFLVMAVVIVIYSDTTLINANWWPMTTFLLVSLYRPTKPMLWLSLLLTVSAFIYESRGTVVCCTVTILGYLLVRLNVKMLRVGYILSFLAAAIFIFAFIHLLTKEPEMMVYVKSIIGDRGFSGREGALLVAYEILYDNNFLGAGLVASNSFLVMLNGFPTDIAIHFGLLDIAYKLSIFSLLLCIYYLMKLIWAVDKSTLPFLMGGLMMTFFYNGIGLSHLGLNLLLLTLISKSYYSGRNIDTKSNV